MRQVLALSILCSTLLTACGNEGPANTNKQGSDNGETHELVVYSGRKPKFVAPILEQFTKDTGIKVKLHNGKASALVKRLELEGARTAADLFLSNDTGSLHIGASKKLFQPMDKAIFTNVPANLRAADQTWVGLSARARVIVINTEAAAAKGISRYADLAAPALQGKLAITSATNGSFIGGVSVLQKQMGDQVTAKWLAALKNNAAGKAYAKHRHVVAAVAKGEKAVGLVNHYYVYRHLDKTPDAPIKMIMPDQGAGDGGLALNAAGIAISKHTKHKVAAEKLVTYLLSDAGQAVFAGVNREFPVNTHVTAKAPLKSLSSYKVADVPLAELGELRLRTIQLIEQSQLP